MAQIEWSASYASGVPAIDAQHMELFGRVNALLDACAKGRGSGSLKHALEYLDAYCTEHFRLEERFMRMQGYPEWEAHAKLHLQLLTLTAELHSHLLANAPSASDVLIFAESLGRWLVDHVAGEDQKVFRFVREKNPNLLDEVDHTTYGHTTRVRGE